MKRRLLSSSTRPTMRIVAIRATVPDVHHVRVFISRHVPIIRAVLIVIRKKAVSVPRALAQVCRMLPLSPANTTSSVVVIALVPIIIMRVVIALATTTANRVVTVPDIISRPKVKRLVISLVSSMVSLVRAVISNVVVTASPVRVAISLVSSMVSPVSSMVSLVRVVISSVAVTASPVRVVMVSSVAVIASILLAMIPMQNIA